MFRQFFKGNIDDLETMCASVTKARNFLFSEDELSAEDQEATGMTSLNSLFDAWGGPAATNFKEQVSTPFAQTMSNHAHILRWMARDLTAAKDILISQRQAAYDIALATRDALKPATPMTGDEIFIKVTQTLIDLATLKKAAEAFKVAKDAIALAFEGFKVWFGYHKAGEGDAKPVEPPPSRSGGATVEEILDVMLDAISTLNDDIVDAEDTFAGKIRADIEEIDTMLSDEGSKDNKSRYLRPSQPTLVDGVTQDTLIPPY